MTGESETRTLRDRHAAAAAELDRAAPAASDAAARRLVQVYTPGTLPTCVPCVYLTHPVTLGAAETEGGDESPAVETATSVPVVVLGAPPSVGDYLAAYAVGGRWVAERMGSGGGFFVCASCSIPATDLTLSWTDLTGLQGSGSVSMTYYGGLAPQWISGCFGCADHIPAGNCSWAITMKCLTDEVWVAVDGPNVGGLYPCYAGDQPPFPNWGPQCDSYPSLTVVIDSLTCGSSFLLSGHTTTSCSNGYFSFTVSV